MKIFLNLDATSLSCSIVFIHISMSLLVFAISARLPYVILYCRFDNVGFHIRRFLQKLNPKEFPTSSRIREFRISNSENFKLHQETSVCTQNMNLRKSATCGDWWKLVPSWWILMSKFPSSFITRCATRVHGNNGVRWPSKHKSNE